MSQFDLFYFLAYVTGFSDQTVRITHPLFTGQNIKKNTEHTNRNRGVELSIYLLSAQITYKHLEETKQILIV